MDRALVFQTRGPITDYGGVNALRTDVLIGAIQTQVERTAVRSYNSPYLDSIVGNKNLSFASSIIAG